MLRKRSSAVLGFTRRRFPAILAILLTLVTCLSVKSAEPRPIDRQVVPDGRQYIDSAQHIVDGDGFVTTFHGSVPLPPRYSPGYPLALAPFVAAKGTPEGQQLGQSVIAILYVLAVVLAAWSLAGPWAGSFAAVIVLLSPFARVSATWVMSDALGALLPLLVIPLMRFRTAAGERLSGALLGFASTVRITAGIGLIAALVVARDKASRIRILLWSLPFLVGLHLLQWAMFGNPFVSGYDNGNAGFSEMISLSNVWGQVGAEGLWMLPEPFPDAWIDRLGPVGATPATGLENLFFYPAVLLGLVWVYIPPLIGLVGFVYAWRHRADPAVRYIVITALGTVFFYLFYEYQASRMVAVSASMVVVLTAAGFARGVAWLGRLERVWTELSARDAADDAQASVQADRKVDEPTPA